VFLKKLIRKHKYNQSNDDLVKCLDLKALIMLCISSCIGTGVYVLTGEASRDYAGPYLSISYLLACLPCFLSALCFAEFSSRVNSSGSSYSFVYYALGEVFAFIVGWCLILSNSI
jgi:basic amino acid/polyamine antiporter, APA family